MLKLISQADVQKLGIKNDEKNYTEQIIQLMYVNWFIIIPLKQVKCSKVYSECTLGWSEKSAEFFFYTMTWNFSKDISQSKRLMTQIDDWRDM